MLNLLRDDPELLAIADAIVATRVFDADELPDATLREQDLGAQVRPRRSINRGDLRV